MKLNINKKYALFFGISSLIIIAVLVVSFAVTVINKGTILKKNLEATDEIIYTESQGKVLSNIAQYLGNNLFAPLYQMDIGSINRLIRDMKTGLPIISFLVADPTGKVLTDGSRENLVFGTQLNADLPRVRKESIIVKKVPEGQQVCFVIKSANHVAGYGQIIYSDEQLKAAIEKHHIVLDSSWKEFQSVLFQITLIGIAAAVIIALFISVLFSGTISRPLMLLKDAANRVAQGDLDYHVEVTSEDEIGELAATFNRMVSDMKRSTVQLQEANKKLMQLDRFKSDVISLVSHELRTPITSIKAFTELILMKPNMPLDQQKKLLTTITTESDRLSRLITDILDLTKIEEGRLSWRITELSIEDIIRSAVDGIQALADNKGLSLIMRVQPSLPRFSGDKDRLIQVVTNILSNAVKFTPEGGSIGIRAYLENGARPRICVTILDTGKGIPADHLELIFEKFHRSGDALTADSQGTGLGLTIARSIVEYHGGKIWAESVQGAGSTFTFTLPLDKERSASSSSRN